MACWLDASGSFVVSLDDPQDLGPFPFLRLNLETDGKASLLDGSQRRHGIFLRYRSIALGQVG
ncbi:MAG TPA: hypothetical protein PLS24_07015, partial [Sedimentisphaerales bacterium]|nr:hypothetical protein [Sedimentisphaerales bacterium]